MWTRVSDKPQERLDLQELISMYPQNPVLVPARFIKKHEHTQLIYTCKIKHQHCMCLHPLDLTLSFAASSGGSFFCSSVLLESCPGLHTEVPNAI
jgi:hypothetical protein